jgi:hypothetical protein
MIDAGVVITIEFIRLKCAGATAILAGQAMPASSSE